MIKEGDYSVLHPPSKKLGRKRQKVFVNMLFSCSVLMPYVDNISLNYFFLGISNNLFNLVYL